MCWVGAVSNPGGRGTVRALGKQCCTKDRSDSERDLLVSVGWHEWAGQVHAHHETELGVGGALDVSSGGLGGWSQGGEQEPQSRSRG